MATEKERLEVEFIATDKASSVAKGVGQEMDKLDGKTADVTIEADDRATAEVRELMNRIDSLTDDDKKVILTAEAKKLEAEVKRATILLGRVDGERAEAVLDARNDAQSKLSAVQTALADLDGETADVKLEATDNASGDIRDVSDRADTLDRKTADVNIEATDNASGTIDTINQKLGSAPGGLGAIAGKLTSPAGALTLLGGSLIAAAGYTADIATEAGTLASLFNSTPEEVSGLAAVLRTTADVEARDLADMIGQMASSLQSTPEDATTLGITLDQVRQSPVRAFIQAIDHIGKDGKFSFEEMQAASRTFGEEGVRQVAAVVAAVGPDGLSGAIAALPDAAIISAEDVRRARTFKREMGELQATLGGIAQDVGGPVLQILSPLVDLLGEAAGLVPVITQPMVDLIVGEQTRIADMTQEMADYIGLLQAGKPQVDAWQLAFGNTDGLERHNELVEDARRFIENGMPVHEAMAEVFGVNEEQALQVAGAFGLLNDATVETTEATDEAVVSQEDFDKAISDTKASLEDEAEQLQENIKLLEDYVDAQTTSYDAEIDYREAKQDTEKALQRYNETLADTEASEEDVRDAGEDLIATVRKQADAHVAAAEAAAIAGGRAFTLTDRINAQNSAFAMLASTIPDELIPQYVDMAMAINDIPANKRTEVTAAIQSRDVALINTTLNNLSQTRTASIGVAVQQAALAATRQQISNVANANYTTTITAVLNAAQVYQQLAYLRAAAAITAAFQGRATGDPMWQGGSVLVGEQGPEIVNLPQGSEIVANHRLDTVGSGGGDTFNQTVINNWPAGTSSRDVEAAQRRYRRTQGPL